jgi:hypothetical protein
MDYRHTEDFARRMEAAALRAPGLRAEAASAFWGWVFAQVASGVRKVRTAAMRPLKGAPRLHGGRPWDSRLRGKDQGVTSLRSSGS